MYKPPILNTNRVKSIKNKFENNKFDNENRNIIGTNNNNNNKRDNIVTTNKVTIPETKSTILGKESQIPLERQLSDPSKRNIKRTPAFRLDKNSEKNNIPFQRGGLLNQSQQDYKHKTLKPLSASKSNDNNYCELKNPSDEKKPKPILFKSKSSIDFNEIRNRFDCEMDNEKSKPNQREEICRINNKVTSALYTEPIPKSLRVMKNHCDKESKPVYSNLQEIFLRDLNNDDKKNIHNTSTLKLVDKKENPKKNLYISTDLNRGGIPNGKVKNCFETSSAIQKLDTLLELTKTNNNSLKKSANSRRQLELTDTIKNALKKPLPKGPPPKKPPRTFEHCFENQSLSENEVSKIIEKNTSFLHVSNVSKKKNCEKPLRRSDPKYMLDKLETALRNNKLINKKSLSVTKTVEMSSSTEESDDENSFSNNLIIDSNDIKLSKNSSPINNNKITNDNCNSSSMSSTTGGNLFVQALNFNCMNGGFCVSSPYSKLNGSSKSSLLSVNGKREEPVYAEPWHFENGGVKLLRNNNNGGSRGRSVSSDRNSRDKKRSSLYYLSSPICGTPRSTNSNSTMSISNNKQIDVPLLSEKCRSEKCQQSPEISPPLSVTSGSTASTPMDDTDRSIIAASLNIKKLIEGFEKRNSIDEKTSNSSRTSWYIEDNNEEEEKEEGSATENDKNIESKDDAFDVPEIRLDDVNDGPDDDDEDSGGNRLDDLRESIAKTIENSFDVSGSESDNKNSERKMSADDPTVKKFISYVRNVSVYAKTRPQWKNSTLFDCCLIVEMNADVRRIKFKYPFNVQVPHKIEDLCFPETACGPVDKTTNAQCYSLVITDEKGQRTFGYCRRVVPEGSNKCLPIAYCILSKHKCPRFYRKILVELESRHGISEYHRNNLLRAFYYNKLPQPGETLTIKLADNKSDKENLNRNDSIDETTHSESLEDSIESNFVIVNEKGEYEAIRSGSKDQKVTKIDNNEIIGRSRADFDVCEENGDIKLNLHHDPIYEISDLKDLHELPLEILQKIFASLLLERKVILISCLLSKLSSCVEALQAIIYPFTWPHSFIPVLPKSLWEFVEAPTPIICGIMSVDVVNKHEIEYGIVVDLDEKCILKEEGDEDKAFCNSLLKTWRRGIVASSKNNNNSSVNEGSNNNSQHFCDAYVNMFAMALKNYRDYIVNGNFQKEAFIRSGRTKGIRRFLKWFTDTTMFLTFVDAVITNSQDFSIFDKKITDYEQESSLTFNKLLLDWK